MLYTIHELAKKAGTTVRTLHYYDEIGLLKPGSVGKNGYRYYGSTELLLLQQILFFKEMDFSLGHIKHMLHSPHFDPVRALSDHRKLLTMKKERLNKLIKSVDSTIYNMSHQQQINSEELYDAFKDDDVQKYQEEVKQRWGNTDAYKQSAAKVGKMTKAQMEKLKEDGKKFTQKLADSMDLPIDSVEVQSLIAEHYKGIQFFYNCPLEMYRNLGKMYVDDPRFTSYYDKFRPGLAVFVRDAIEIYCNEHGIT